MLGHIADNLMYVAFAFSVLVIVGILVFIFFKPKFFGRKLRTSGSSRSQQPPGDREGKKVPPPPTNTPSQTPEHITNLESAKRQPEISQPSGTPQRLADREDEKSALGDTNTPSQTPENTADNLNDSSDLKLLLEKLLEEVQSIRESLNSIEDILQGQVPSQTQKF